jgi:site-specific DNA recombinase
MPSSTGPGSKRAILYARVSTEEQGKSGYSIPDELRELRAHAAREGYRVVEEAVDDGHSGADLHRPGLRRVMEPAESGAIDVVLAKKRNMLFRSRLYRLLWDQDLGELGVSLIALDDTGNRFGDAMQDAFAEWEREAIARRTQDGLLEKCRNGLIIKRRRPAYGFRASEDGNALEVSEPEMGVVRRIFRSVAGGATVYHVRCSLERDGIPAPSGIGRWNHTTIRNIVASELYAPHLYEEVAELVEPGVAMRLDREAAYGLWAWNTKKPRGARFGTKALASSRSATATSGAPEKSGCLCRCQTPESRGRWWRRLNRASRTTHASLRRRPNASGSSPAVSCAAESAGTP